MTRYTRLFIAAPLATSAARAQEHESPMLLSDTVIDPAALTVKGIYGQAINGLPFQMEAL